MSLFGSLMGDFDDDMGFMGNHMNAMNMQMRSMNRLMNSFMPDPFQMFNPFDNGFQQNALMERGGPGQHMGGLFGFPAMPNMNRLLNADIGAPNGASFCSSSIVTMSSGPDGRPQIYQATQSTKTGPGGVRETRKTVQDSTTGVKKMAIGHHIGERAHIIEKEQDLRSGQLEERQEFINLDEEEAEDFDREFINKAGGSRGGAGGGLAAIRAAPTHHRNTGGESLTIEEIVDDDEEEYARPSRRQLPAPPAQHSNNSSAASASSPSSSSPKSSTKATTTTTAHLTADNKNRKKSSASSVSSSVSSSSTNNATQNHNNNSNSYLSATPRRTYRSHHLPGSVSSVQPRRPLRTPPSSPLATTPVVHSHSTITSSTSPSVHPHPYNSTAARRLHQHRPAKNANKHMKHQPNLDDVITIKTPKTKASNCSSQSKHNDQHNNKN